MATKFSQAQKREHYTNVASGKEKTKRGSKFSKKEQEAYARGQRDARNESLRIYAYKNSTPDQRKAYAEKRKAEREAYRRSREAK